jgi:hypothetical protein
MCKLVEGSVMCNDVRQFGMYVACFGQVVEMGEPYVFVERLRRGESD